MVCLYEYPQIVNSVSSPEGGESQCRIARGEALTVHAVVVHESTGCYYCLLP